MLENGNINRNGKTLVIHYTCLRLNFKRSGTLFLRGQPSNQGRGLWCTSKREKRQLSFHHPTTSVTTCQGSTQIAKVILGH